MKTLSLCLLSLMLSFTAGANSANEQSPLLIKLKQDIFAEMIRFHGKEIKSATVLRWCGLPELADEIGLSDTEFKRAIYQSFIVAGSQNVTATEIARQMTDDQWSLYNNALHSELQRYREGLVYGLDLSLPEQTQKRLFCQQREHLALQAARTLSSN